MAPLKDQKSLPFLKQMVQFPSSVGGPLFKSQLDKTQQIVGNPIFDIKPLEISKQPRKVGVNRQKTQTCNMSSDI